MDRSIQHADETFAAPRPGSAHAHHPPLRPRLRRPSPQPVGQPRLEPADAGPGRRRVLQVDPGDAAGFVGRVLWQRHACARVRQPHPDDHQDPGVLRGRRRLLEPERLPGQGQAHRGGLQPQRRAGELLQPGQPGGLRPVDAADHPHAPAGQDLHAELEHRLRALLHGRRAHRRQRRHLQRRRRGQAHRVLPPRLQERQGAGRVDGRQHAQARAPAGVGLVCWRRGRHGQLRCAAPGFEPEQIGPGGGLRPAVPGTAVGHLGAVPLAAAAKQGALLVGRGSPRWRGHRADQPVPAGRRRLGPVDPQQRPAQGLPQGPLRLHGLPGRRHLLGLLVQQLLPRDRGAQRQGQGRRHQRAVAP